MFLTNPPNRCQIRPNCRLLLLIGLLCASGWAADWTAPAEFTVSDVVVNENPGAWTATMVSGPANSWLAGGSYEPMSLRRKWHALADSPNEIVLNNSDICYYNSWSDGIFDGANVRVYRITNGEFVKVREDTIAHHYASDWMDPEAMEMISPDTSRAEISFASWYRHDADYHFNVVAVDDQGNESDDSNVVTVHWTGWTDEFVYKQNDEVSFEAPSDPTETIAPAAPLNLTADYDTASGLITLNWDAVADADLAAYRIYYCDRDPNALNGLHIYLTDSPTDPDLHIKTGDMIFMEKEMYEWDKDIYLTHRVHGTSQEGLLPGLIPFHNDTTKHWSFVAHPGTVPAELAKEAGQSCLQLDLTDDEEIKIASYNFGDMTQDWYNVLETNKTYVVEFWARQMGMVDPTVTFKLGSFYYFRVPYQTYTVTGEWQKFSGTFSVDELFESAGSVGQMMLTLKGPGQLWIDNFRVYEQGTPYLGFSETDYAELRASGIQFIRTHSTVRTGFGHTMEMLTNARGGMGPRGWRTDNFQHTMDSLLSMMDHAEIDPWLQIEMFMTEDEWLGWMEFMAAPYDPAVDTPDSKPWAYKRYQQGRTEPWTDAFERILFELSNETWNPLFAPWSFLGYSMTDTETGADYQAGHLYGLWQEYVIAQLKKSPYWTETVAEKMEFVLGGWAANSSTSGYGHRAASVSPNSQHVTLAAYNGGWDEGEPPAESNDETRFKTLAFAAQVTDASAQEFATAAQEGNYQIGTYEAGPGYNINGLNGVSMTDEQVEAESQVMKSLIGGTAALDSFLMRARYGYDLQNFFTFERNRHYWTSHARWEYGGQAYPCWTALSLYNRYGTGDHLLVHQNSAPSWDLPATDQRNARENAPMTAVYATRTTNSVSLFCISRKMDGYPVEDDDGYTPLTVNLPFTLGADSSIKLYKMTGDTRSHNLDTNNVEIVSEEIATAGFSPIFSLTAARGADDRGLPPASSFLYVFEGVEFDASGETNRIQIQLEETVESPTLDLPISYRIVLGQPVDPDLMSACAIPSAGSAEISSFSIAAVPFTENTEYRLDVNGAATLGTLIPQIEANALGDHTQSDYYGPVVELAISENLVTISFDAVDDKWVSSYEDEDDGGDSRYLRSMFPYTERNLGDRALLKFPTLPDLGDRMPVRAVVRIYHDGSFVSADYDAYHVLFGYPDDWSESDSIAYSELSLLTSADKASDAQTFPTNGDWYEFDCTRYVTNTLAGDHTVSLALAFDTEGADAANNYFRWRSKEYDNGEYAPQLVLYFDPLPLDPIIESIEALGDGAVIRFRNDSANRTCTLESTTTQLGGGVRGGI